jgi:lysophospholipid acyltransferase (LPLAT)-like uncharacterized protein
MPGEDPSPESPPPVSRRKRKSGVVVPHKAVWHGKLAAAVIYGCIRVVAATIRFKWHDRAGLFQQSTPQPVIYAIWHNRLALSLILFQRYPQRLQPQRRMAAIVSASKDGALLARVLEHFRVQPVRGSTSRRGPQALLELTTWAERGFDLAITPDGPRGPRYVVQEGAVALAQLTGQPVVPVSYYLAWKVRVRSWDGFQVPLPFSRCDVYLGEPVTIPRNASDPERETLRLRLEERLQALTPD